MSLIIDIEKSFPDFSLSVSLECGEGTLALLGGSGCGKSLTLKCIAGLEKPDRGLIIINGQTVFDCGGNGNRLINIPPQRRGIGYLFQNYALFPTMTVQNNITCVIKKPKKERTAIADNMINLFGLDEIRNLYPRQISGGQQQRTALARILVCEPKILLLDEPFSALDSHLRWSVEQEIGLLLSRFAGTTIFVSHNSGEVYRLCDRIAVMSQGKIDCTGTKTEIFELPKTLASARIVGIRNISKAEKLGENLVKATEWGVNLKTEKPVPDKVSHVAIRSHDLTEGYGQDDDNILNCTITRVIHEPSKKIVILAPETGHQDTQLQKIQFETTNDYLPQGTLKLKMPRDKIILLEG